MPVEFLIDGYNLLHNAGLGRAKYGPGEFDRARNRLLKRLQDSLTEEERTRTSIVFDAQFADHADRRPVILYGMTILFSPRGRQADDLIEILLAAHPHPQQVVVVSSDHRLLRAARIARAASLSSDAFLVDLEERKLKAASQNDREMPAPSSAVRLKTSRLDSQDVDRWLLEFGDVDVAALEREAQREMRSMQTEPQLPEKRNSQSPSQPEGLPADGTSSLTSDDPLGDWLQGVIPLDRGTGSVRSKRSVSDAVTKHENSSAELIPETELNFWRQRVEEMLREEDL